jgi:hypothetical protein
VSCWPSPLTFGVWRRWPRLGIAPGHQPRERHSHNAQLLAPAPAPKAREKKSRQIKTSQSVSFLLASMRYSDVGKQTKWDRACPAPLHVAIWPELHLKQARLYRCGTRKQKTRPIFIGSCGCFSNQAYNTNTESPKPKAEEIDKVPYPHAELGRAETNNTQCPKPAPRRGLCAVYTRCTAAAGCGRDSSLSAHSGMVAIKGMVGSSLVGMVGSSLVRTHDVIAFASSEVMGLFVA